MQKFNQLYRTNDLDFAEKRIARLEDDVRDQIVRDDEDGNALNQLKREKREMDHQVEELREELDEALSELERAEQERDRLRVSLSETTVFSLSLLSIELETQIYF